MRIISHRTAALLALAVLMSSACGRSVAGDVTFYTVFKNVLYNQTSNSAPATPSFYFVNGSVNSNTPGDLVSGSITYPGPNSPIALTKQDPTTLSYGFSYASRAAMEAAFPDGSTYNFTVNTLSNPQTRTGTLAAPANSLFTSNVPFVSNLGQLQGVDATKPFTVTFPSTTATSGSNASAIFFTIFGAITSGGLPDGSTSFFLPANTLKPGTTYTYEIDYTNRLSTRGNGDLSTGFAVAGYDVRTDGTFTTAAVPEPAGLSLAAVCLGGLALRAWRRRV
jgi:hypothetical protein